MELIATQTLTSDAASVTFSSIPQTGTDLVIYVSSKSAQTGTGINFYMQYNGSSSSYSYQTLRIASTASASRSTSNPTGFVGWQNDTITSYSIFGAGHIYIARYTASISHGSGAETTAEINATGNLFGITANLHATGAPITSLSLYFPGTNIATGSTFSLYKVTKL